MAEHLSMEQLERFRKRMLSPQELLSVDEHISACEECRNKVSDDDKIRASVKFWKADLEQASEEFDHPSYEVLKEYVEDRLDEVDREIIDSHLDLCPLCRMEVEEMRSS